MEASYLSAMTYRSQVKCNVKLEFHGTDTGADTDIRERLSCNFVNGYTHDSLSCTLHVYTYVYTRDP